MQALGSLDCFRQSAQEMLHPSGPRFPCLEADEYVGVNAPIVVGAVRADARAVGHLDAGSAIRQTRFYAAPGKTAA